MIKSGYSQEDLARMGPDELTKRRLLAEALLSDASKQRKIEHPLQGMAQMAEALMGGLRMRRLDQAQTSGQSAADKVWSGIFGGGGSPAPSSQPSASNIPMPGAAGEIAATDPIKGDVYGPFMDTIKAGGVNNPYALAAIASTGRAESGWSAKNAGRTWSDPSASGQPGTAGGIMSWRGPRYQALAATGDLSPQGQAKFFLNEDPGLIQALNKAGSVEEAQRLMNNAWKFAGYDQPGGEAARRLGYAKGYLPEFQGGNEVASLDPSAGAPAGNATAYVDPMVSAPNGGGGFDMGRFGPQMDLTKNPTSPAQLPAELRTQAAALQSPAPVQTPTPQAQVADNAKLGAALTGGGPSQEQLMSIISNPWMSDERKKIAQMLLGQKIEQQNAIRDQQMKQADPAYQIQLEKNRLELEAMRNPKPDIPDSVQALDLRAQRAGLQPGTPEYADFMRSGGGGGVNVTVNGQDESEFAKKAAGRNVDRFGTLADAGTQAASVAQTIPVMRELLSQAPQGPVSGRLAEMFPGFSTAGDAFIAQVNQIAPTLRVPGSGAMSDRDMDVLMSSFPRLRGNAEANQIIMNVFERKAQLNAERGAIASAALRGEITPADADKRIAEIDKQPLFDDRTRSILANAGKTPAENPLPSAPGKGPEAGAVEDGYRFKGGNPSDPNSWEKVE